MRIATTSDHAGVEHLRAVVEELTRQGHECIELGRDNHSAADDYPDFAEAVARCVVDGNADLAVCVCGTGIGMSIAANKVPGIRAAVCWNEFTAEVSRTHNNANVLCLGSRTLDAETAAGLAVLWVRTRFEGGRHARRVDKITDLEKRGCRAGKVC